MLGQALDPNIIQLLQVLMQMKRGGSLAQQPSMLPSEAVAEPSGQTIGGMDPQTWLRLYQGR
jgi:hypothetical protein